MDCESIYSKEFDNQKGLLLMLNMAMLQLDTIINDGKESEKSMIRLFRIMTDFAMETRERDTTLVPTLPEDALEISDDAFAAFQFFDRTSQRLAFLRGIMESMAELVANLGRDSDADGLRRMLDSFRDGLTVENDRAMFDAISRGATVREAIEASGAIKDSDNVEIWS